MRTGGWEGRPTLADGRRGHVAAGRPAGRSRFAPSKRGRSVSVRARGTGGAAAAWRIGARGRVRRRACAGRSARPRTGPLPGGDADAHQGGGFEPRGLTARASERICSPLSAEGGNRTPDRVIMSHVLFPTELLRWRNEPRAPNDTRRAMVSLGAPDRHPEPEPLFGPRSHYPMDGPRCGGRRGSFGARGTRRFRPGGSERGSRGASHGYGTARRAVAEGSRPLRWCRAVEVVRAVKERSGCTSIRGRGNKKAPVGLHAGRGFRFRETCGGAFLRGSPDRCPGDLGHELTVHGP